MDLSRLIAELALPAAFPEPVSAVEVRQTHISIVLLAGDVVYKIRKPVKLPFVDFSTLELRRRDCDAEVRLNARLAADVYLGVVPIVRHAGRLQIDGIGEPLEWAVKMRRLADDDTLAAHLQRDQVDRWQMVELAGQLAAFHRQAERGPRIAEFGRFETVAANARGNFEQSRSQIGGAVTPGVFERLERRTAELLDELRPVFENRAARGVPCDTHGDLRTDHIYFLRDERSGERYTVAIDCLEFNDAFRYADPVSDMAFLAMDLLFAGRQDLADAFIDAYFAAADDAEGRGLLPFYIGYRAAVRGKVEGLKAAEAEVPTAEREQARARATSYWLLALGALEPAERRPALVLVAGLPGSGKSTLAALLSKQAGFATLRSDVVRKELAKVAAGEKTSSRFGEGLYTPRWNERTYAECLARAETMLREGGRVIVDASFREDAWRREFLELAARLRVPGLLFVCQAETDAIRRRLAERRGDASDADWSIYQAAAQAWEPASPPVAAQQHLLSASQSREETLQAALAILGARRPTLWT